MSMAASSIAPSRLRCAVYTRKSSEEGLEQEFNSLDAQHEACQAYVASQASLGWRLVPERYDDGGISGGTMERPALKRLLQDISEGRIDVVVVYKIDRLTRSLTDFARIVEIFDRAGASFVSVTQQFNTTTSMGRLTLNVLLSFAQFEREVTAERIRDKIAASKKKGMWMGGQVPLGYRVENRKLLIDEEEAATVRFLFDRYLELKSVKALGREARDSKLTVRRANPRGGAETHRTAAFSPGNLYHLLSNPIYIGMIRHKEQLHQGEHQPIIDKDTFQAAQALLSEQASPRRSTTNQQDVHLLTGLIYDQDGNRMRPVHSRRGHRRWRYYVSKAHIDGQSPARPEWRLPADELDALILHQVGELLSDQVLLATWVQEQQAETDPAQALRQAEALQQQLSDATPTERRTLIRSIIQRVDLQTGQVTISFDRGSIIAKLTSTPAPSRSEAAADDSHIVTCAISQRKRGVEKKLVLDTGRSQARAPDANLIELIVKARMLFGQLTDGSQASMQDTASRLGIDRSDFSRLLPLAFLSPHIVEAIVAGQQPVDLTAQRLFRIGELPMSWAEQEAILAA
jgi:DNA invertase Pin-like site-specific DNA recombinase